MADELMCPCKGQLARIRLFPQNAVIDKTMLMTERKTSLPCTSPVSSTEQLICVLQLLAMRGYSQPNSFFNTSALLI